MAKTKEEKIKKLLELDNKIDEIYKEKKDQIELRKILDKELENWDKLCNEFFKLREEINKDSSGPKVSFV